MIRQLKEKKNQQSVRTLICFFFILALKIYTSINDILLEINYKSVETERRLRILYYLKTDSRNQMNNVTNFMRVYLERSSIEISNTLSAVLVWLQPSERWNETITTKCCNPSYVNAINMSNTLPAIHFVVPFSLSFYWFPYFWNISKCINFFA